MPDNFTFPAPSDAKKLTDAKLRVNALIEEMKGLPEVKSVSDDALYAIAIMIEGRTSPQADAFVGIGLKNIRERGQAKSDGIAGGPLGSSSSFPAAPSLLPGGSPSADNTTPEQGVSQPAPQPPAGTPRPNVP